MKALNKPTQKLFGRIFEGLAPGKSKKIDNEPTFMALHVERLSENLFSLAHYYVQNGDSVPDPDMELWMDTDGTFYPVALQQNTGHHTQAMEIGEDGKPKNVNLRAQAELCSFAALWARNLRVQQNL